MGNQAALVFVHGWAADSWVWQGLAGFFKGRTVHNLNLPGHGGQGRWTETDLGPAVKQLERLALEIKDREIIGIGWSLGAQALLASAANIRYRALILVGATPSFVGKPDFPWGQSKALVRRMIGDMKKDPAATTARFYPLNFTETELGTDAAREFIERYRYPGPIVCDDPRMPGCFPAFKYGEITNALGALYETDLRQNLAIDTPALIVHGAEDQVTPVGAAEYLAKNMKGSKLEVFDGAGHAPFLTRSDLFNDMAIKFIGGI